MNSTAPILNFEILERATFNDRVLLKEIIEMLAGQISYFEDEMNDIFSTENNKNFETEKILTFIHKLKGLSASIGAEKAENQTNIVRNYISNDQKIEKTEIHHMTSEILQNLETAKIEMIKYFNNI